MEHKSILELINTSRLDIEKFCGDDISFVQQNDERRAIFRDDVRNIHGYLKKDYLTGDETRNVANMLYRWLFDKWHPMLQELSNELGIQLTLPVASDERQEYEQLELIKTSDFMLTMHLGKRNLMGYQWAGRRRFATDVVMVIKGTSIHIEAFVKFVRHKLGGAHFDAHDRNKWQKDLAAMTRYWREDRDFLNHHMREVLVAVSEGVFENRLEQHVGD